MVWPAIIAAGAALAKGAMESHSQSEASQESREYTDKDDLNYHHQKEFAQEGIRWKVADAKAAGLHPLAALGAQTMSFQPSSAGGIPGYGGDYGLGEAGQNISRAMSAKKTEGERQVEELELRRMKAATSSAESKAVIDKINADRASNPPALPMVGSPLEREGGIPGQDSGTVNGAPNGFQGHQKTRSQRLGIEEGTGPIEQETVDSDGYLWTFPTQQVGEGLESSWFDQGKYALMKAGREGVGMVDEGLAWLANKIFGSRYHDYVTPRRLEENRPAAPDGFEYRWNPWRQQWRLCPEEGKLYDTVSGRRFE